MKQKLISIATLILLTSLANTALAQTPDYLDAEDVVPIELSAEFNELDELIFTWDEPQESDIDFYQIIKSNEDSMPESFPGDAEIVVNSDANSEDIIFQDPNYAYLNEVPSQGITYYRMCTYTILNTRGCGNVLPVYGAKSLILEPAVEGFPDIEGHWGEKFIEKLRVLNVVEGYEDGGFEPNSNILRAEAIKIIMLTFGIGGTSCHGDFYPDMGHTDWFCDVVSKATQLEYVQGDQGNLYPGREITRAEAVKVVLEVKGVDVPEITVKPFSDVEVEEWYARYISKAKELNIVQGMGNNVFEPNRSITRAELSKIAAEAADL